MKIVLCCAMGLSTSLLVDNIKAVCEEGDEIVAVPLSDLKDVIQAYDVCLLGPQIRYKEKVVHSYADPYNIPVAVVDMIAYGRMDGKGAYNQAKELYGGKKS